MIEKLVPVHEDDLSPLAAIKLFYKPILCGSGNVPRRNHKDVVNQYLPTRIGIEDRVVYRHAYLVQNGRGIAIAAPSACVQLASLDLAPKYSQ